MPEMWWWPAQQSQKYWPIPKQERGSSERIKAQVWRQWMSCRAMVTQCLSHQREPGTSSQRPPGSGDVCDTRWSSLPCALDITLKHLQAPYRNSNATVSCVPNSDTHCSSSPQPDSSQTAETSVLLAWPASEPVIQGWKTEYPISNHLLSSKDFTCLGAPASCVQWAGKGISFLLLRLHAIHTSRKAENSVPSAWGSFCLTHRNGSTHLLF